MRLFFDLQIPDHFVDLEIANNYRQKTEKIGKNVFRISISGHPREIVNILKKPLDKNIRLPKFLKKFDGVFNNYEQLFLLVRRYVQLKMKQNLDMNDPFAYYYNKRWGRSCTSYNAFFGEILSRMGFKTRLVGGLILSFGNITFEDEIEIISHHTWVDIYLDGRWIELDAVPKQGSILVNPLAIRLFDYKGKLKFEIEATLKGTLRPIIK